MSRLSLALARTALALAAVTLAGGAPVHAADVAKTVGTFDAWAAYTYGDGGARLCYMYATPQKSQGEYTRRGDTFIQVSHRPGEKSFDVVSVTAGYSYKPDSEAEIEIDGTKYALFTKDDGAWARDARDDARLVTAMKAGAAMVVRGVSARGTLTIDSYSLKGFTAAHAAIDKACGVR
jgi:hypothetical protein